VTITSSQTGGFTAAIFLLLRRSRFVQCLAGLPRNSQPLGRGAEFLMVATLRALRELTGRNISPIRAAFAHARNTDMLGFARLFGCPVEFG
jgi:Arabinose-binding domain of AraC transcription regulator, N-term